MYDKVYNKVFKKIKYVLRSPKQRQSKIKNNPFKRVWTLLFFIIISIQFLYPEKVAIITDVLKPTSLTIDEQYIYINENSTIYIYSAENYKFLNKFGREGEGPEEFKGPPTIIPQKEYLIINSIGKVSFFSKDGKFIKELKTPSGQSMFFPLKTGFIGKGRLFENNISYFTVNLFDPGLKKGKEIYRVQDFQQMGKAAIYFPIREPKYTTLNNKIIIAGKPGFIIEILDHTGKRLYLIENKNFKKRKFTTEDEKVFREFLKNTYKERYDRYKQYVHFLDYYPEISFIFTDNNKIYITTWRISNDKVELLEYDIKGKLLNVFYVKIIWQSVLKPYPIRIKNGKIYQLIENQEEQWELHISKLMK